jgi:hypothetical protein
MKNHKIKIIAITGITLALVSIGAWATSATVSWNPNRLAPASITPGESMNATVVFTNKGPSSINGKKLALEIRGEVKTLVSLTQPNFPQMIKKGENVSVNLSVHSPSDQTVRVVTGTLAIVELKPNGTVKDTFTATLPVEITLSPFFIPPAPDKALDESTIEGVDSNANGVPDRVDRFIAFAAPESEKKRVAMTLSAKAQQDFFIDYLEHLGEDPNDAAVVARVLAVDAVRGKNTHCLRYVFGANVSFNTPGGEEAFDAYSKKDREIEALFMDTPERIRAFWQSERPLVATSYPNISREQLKRECLDLGFDPDTLPN